MVGKLSMPRSELQAAKLAVQVRNMIQAALPQKPLKEHFWTDSENVLAWIQRPPEDFKVFVSNRVQFIRETVHPSQWNHVKGKDNPADIPTRGCLAKELKDGKTREKWLHGPEWLKKSQEQWPKSTAPITEPAEVTKERKVTVLFHNKKDYTVSPLEQYFLKGRDLDYKKLQAIMLHCLRFTSWKRVTRQSPPIPGVRTKIEVKKGLTWPTKEEQKLVEDGLIRHIQTHYFGEVIHLLKNPTKMDGLENNKSKSLILSLGLVLENDIIYVQGRIHFKGDNEPYGQLILMPGMGPVSWTIMKKYHLSTLHGGSNHALLASRERFWFLRGGKLAINVRKKCSNCIPFDRKPISVPEATLPKERITPCYPFEVTGLDFAGPISGIGPTKNDQEKKYYVLIFTCAVTRMVSFELTAAVDTEHFIMAFDTFKSQKGKPQKVYSDNAQTFRSVEKQITLPMSDWEQVMSGNTEIA
jgi:hypothetical protein